MGARRPLLEAPRPARHVHGEDGMGDLGLPEPAGAPPPLDAVDLLRDVLVAAADTGQRVTLVPLAPLTNVALLLRTYPEAARGLARIVFMGGAALVGNATAAAEFNVFHDPEAAAIVLDAAAELGVPVTMYGLDVFYEVRVPRADGERLAASADPAARLAGRRRPFPGGRGGGGGPPRHASRAGWCCSSATGSAGTTPRSATPGRCAPSSTPAASSPSGGRSGSSSPARGPAGRPSSTAARGPATTTTTRTASPRRSSTWLSASTARATPSSGCRR